MFENVGAKIKGLSIFVVIVGSMLMIMDGCVKLSQEDPFGSLVMCFGPVVCWVISWFVYAFGELVENSSVIATCVKDNKVKESQTAAEPSRMEELAALRDKGLITEEEYKAIANRGQKSVKNAYEE